MDRKYAEGPETQRSCTDIFCLIIFIAFLAGLVYIGFLGYSSGNPEYLVYPFDSDRLQCKFSPGYEDYPYIFITVDPFKGLRYVCVKSCPSSENSTLDCKLNNSTTSCDTLLVYPTTNLATYCAPQDSKLTLITDAGERLIADILSIGPLQIYFSDVYVGWRLLCWMILVSFAVSLLYSVLIRYFAGCMVWTMLLLLLVLLLAIGLVTALLPSVQFLQDLLNYGSLPETLRDRNFQIACSVITLFLFTVGMLVVCCMRRQIRICIT